jgi:hypothetical protein
MSATLALLMFGLMLVPQQYQAAAAVAAEFTSDMYSRTSKTTVASSCNLCVCVTP